MHSLYIRNPVFGIQCEWNEQLHSLSIFRTDSIYDFLLSFSEDLVKEENSSQGEDNPALSRSDTSLAEGLS